MQYHDRLLLCHFSIIIIAQHALSLMKTRNKILDDTILKPHNYSLFHTFISNQCSFTLTIKLYLLLWCHHWNLDPSIVSGIGLQCYCELLSEIEFPALTRPCTTERKPTPFMLTLFVCLFAHARRFMRTCLYFFVYLPTWFCGHYSPQVYIVPTYPCWDMFKYSSVCVNMTSRQEAFEWYRWICLNNSAPVTLSTAPIEAPVSPMYKYTLRIMHILTCE